MVKKLALLMLILCLPSGLQAEDRIELKTTIIKGNKELPRVLYIVPWKDVQTAAKPRQELVLHSLFGDLFDPVVPAR